MKYLCNVPRQNLKKFESIYIMHTNRILNQNTAIIKSCDTVLNSQLTKALFNCVK